MNNLTRVLIGVATGTVFGTAYVALRRGQRDGEQDWSPAVVTPLRREEEEPILGYDGMDVDTLVDWIERSDLDSATLRHVRAYEMRHRKREAVLSTVDELLR